MKEIVLKINKRIDIDCVIPREKITDTGVVLKKQIPTKCGITTFLMSEMWYIRIKSYISIVIMSDMRDDETTVEIITAGGGGASLGAETTAAWNVADILIGLGFRKVRG